MLRLLPEHFLCYNLEKNLSKGRENMICYKCKQNIDEDSNYCKYCGAKQAIECGECGAAVPADARFCPKCDALVQAQVGFDWDAMTKEAKSAFGKED